MLELWDSLDMDVKGYAGLMFAFGLGILFFSGILILTGDPDLLPLYVRHLAKEARDTKGYVRMIGKCSAMVAPAPILSAVTHIAVYTLAGEGSPLGFLTPIVLIGGFIFFIWIASKYIWKDPKWHESDDGNEKEKH